MAKKKRAKDIQHLAKRVNDLRSDGKQVVMCHGVFDLLHIGHIRHFREAAEFGDILVVTLTPDRFVNKGIHRPAFPEELRAEAIASLDMVDLVAINEWPTAVDTIHAIKPDIYCKGGEYRTAQIDASVNLQPELVAAKEEGVVVKYTDDVVFSSSELLNRHFTSFSPETDAWLGKFRLNHTETEIVGYLDQAKDLKVLVIGDAIIDEYVFCETIGKSTKDPVLACLFGNEEAFAGGSLAIANHLAGFCDSVGLITCVGDDDHGEDFAREALLPNVKSNFLTRVGSPTIRKRRFLDAYSQSKLLELYVMDDTPLGGAEEADLLSLIQSDIDDYDLVIAADFGHGMLSPGVVSLLCEKAKFLCVNTQSNAGNRGFNPISKYPRADYVCLADHEIEMETRMKGGDPASLLLELADKFDCSRFTVTRGKEGSIHLLTGEQVVEVPAFATKVTDRVGAGDAVLALTSLLVAQEAPWDITGFVGNVAGAQIVTELGNRVPISKVPLVKHVISLLK